MGEEKTLCHRRLEHTTYSKVRKLVIGLFDLKYKKDRICDAYKKDRICDTYKKGMQHRLSFKFLSMVYTSRFVELLHMGLFRPTQTQSFSRKIYT